MACNQPYTYAQYVNVFNNDKYDSLPYTAIGCLIDNDKSMSMLSRTLSIYINT